MIFMNCVKLLYFKVNTLRGEGDEKVKNKAGYNERKIASVRFDEIYNMRDKKLIESCIRDNFCFVK